ncbi:protein STRICTOSIDINE SYNTHASE-LIKE 6-like [Typha latifolia]|uniref:protein STRICTOSIDINE SYNTHASE-LIKE 6-like n=1 Tax=Typha latifolia TaxID=4733 RepID=UPI003C2CB948
MAGRKPSPPPYSLFCKSGVLCLLLFLTPIVLSFVIHKTRFFGSGDYLFSVSGTRPLRRRLLQASERIGKGLRGPMNLAYDGETGYLYIGCCDSWIRRVGLVGDENDEHRVEDWVRVGGEPRGIALAPDRSLIVADAYEGLLKVMPDKTIKLLTYEAEGVAFALTSAVDVASDGVIYFIDGATTNDAVSDVLKILLAKPQGRLMSFDPSTNRTVVLARDLCYVNALTLSSDQNSLIFCEVILRRCRRYHIRGENRGKIDKFIEKLPGFPYSISYEQEGHYWIGLSWGRTCYQQLQYEYPILRKIAYILNEFGALPDYLSQFEGLSVTLEGTPLHIYTARELLNGTSWLKIGKYLYYSSWCKNYISRVDLTQYVAEE